MVFLVCFVTQGFAGNSDGESQSSPIRGSRGYPNEECVPVKGKADAGLDT